jgi:hypothetical protein
MRSKMASAFKSGVMVIKLFFPKTNKHRRVIFCVIQQQQFNGTMPAGE